MRQHELTADILEVDDNKIAVTIKESDISFDDIIYLIKYSDNLLNYPLLSELKRNKKYLSSIHFKIFQICFEFESTSQRDYWLKKYKNSIF